MISISAISILAVVALVTGLLLRLAARRVQAGRGPRSLPTSPSGTMALLSSAICLGAAVIVVHLLSRAMDTGALLLPRSGNIPEARPALFWSAFAAYFVIAVFLMLCSAGPYFTRWARRHGR